MSRPQLGEDPDLSRAVEAARAGDRDALSRLVVAIQGDVFRLALRMTGHREDARDATQEILIKVVTRLDGFRAESGVRTWAYRIALHHLLDRKKSRVEAMALNLRRFGEDLLDGLSAEPDPDPFLAGEVKVGCTLAMLTCLDRSQRIAYVLGEVFEIPNAEAAALTGVDDEVHRQRLSRGRRSLEAFTESFCGLVEARAPCRCDRRVARAVELGRIHRDRPRHSLPLAPSVHAMETLHRTAELLRTSDVEPPVDLLGAVLGVLDAGGLG